jgi:hypothetical protein
LGNIPQSRGAAVQRAGRADAMTHITRADLIIAAFCAVMVAIHYARFVA